MVKKSKSSKIAKIPFLGSIFLRSPLGTRRSENTIGRTPATADWPTGAQKGTFAILRGLCLLLPSVLFFSYQPNISLGQTESMHLDLSLPLIFLVAISVLTIPLLPQIFKYIPKKLLVAAIAIPCYTMISLIWSNNPLRTFLSTGVLTCLVLVILALLFLAKISSPAQLASFKKAAIRLFLATSVIVSIFAWLQCILDVFGISREMTLLCEGCTYQAFGFPHPNAFAIEPQFFGNLLLAPSFLCLYYLLYHKNYKKSIKASFSQSSAIKAPIFPLSILWIMTLFLVTTLFFTFSRGAIYAFLASTIVLIIYHLCKKHFKYLILVPVILCSATFALICQGIFAQISPTTDTFFSGISKSINHLTLGTIDLRSSNSASSSSRAPVGQPAVAGALPIVFSREKIDPEIDEDAELDFETKDINFSSSELAEVTTEQERPSPVTTGARDATADENIGSFGNGNVGSKFSGYVEESTDFRLSLTNMALTTWSSDPRIMLLGTGLGGAGPVLYAKYPELGTAQQIVQNEYASLLLEFGLVGVAVITMAATLIITSVKIKDKTQKSWLLALLFAYAVTLCFFSGLPNALHIYLLPAFALIFSKHQLLVHYVVQKHNH